MSPLFQGSLIPETLEAMESDEDFKITSANLKKLGQAKLTRQERKNRQRALDDLGVPDFRQFWVNQKKQHGVEGECNTVLTLNFCAEFLGRSRMIYNCTPSWVQSIPDYLPSHLNAALIRKHDIQLHAPSWVQSIPDYVCDSRPLPSHLNAAFILKLRAFLMCLAYSFHVLHMGVQPVTDRSLVDCCRN